MTDHFLVRLRGAYDECDQRSDAVPFKVVVHPDDLASVETPRLREDIIVRSRAVQRGQVYVFPAAQAATWRSK